MHRFTSIFCTLMLALGTSSVAATEPLPDELLVPAAKIDSGLGEIAARAAQQLTRAP